MSWAQKSTQRSTLWKEWALEVPPVPKVRLLPARLLVSLTPTVARTRERASAGQVSPKLALYRSPAPTPSDLPS
jgi:hypothetical protein